MKLLYPLSIILLLGVVFYQHFSSKYQYQVLTDQVAMLEQQKTELVDEYETRIAKLKFEYDSQLSARVPRYTAGPESLRDIIQDIREKRVDARTTAINEARHFLNLNNQEFQDFKKILDNFEDNKRGVLQLSIQEGQPFVDQRYIDMLDDYRSQVLTELEEVFGRERMQELEGNSTIIENIGL